MQIDWNNTYKKIGKILPVSIKQALIAHLQKSLFSSHLNSQTALNAVTEENPWWPRLRKQSNNQIFVKLDLADKNACNEIRINYHPILQQYGVDSTEFFMGSIKDKDAEALYALVRKRKPKTVYQVGTFVGYSAMVIAHALRANGHGRLIAVDPEIPHRTFINPVDVAREVARLLDLEKYIQFVRGCHSIALGDFIGYKMGKKVPVIGRAVLEGLKDEVDFAFIDGDHSVCATISDFMTLKDYLKIKGVVVFHDVYSWSSVAHAIALMLDDNYFYVRGTGTYYSLDTSHGWDGLAAFEQIERSKIPVMRIKIISDQDKQPIACAIIKIPSLNLEARTSDNGTAYIYHELYSDTIIEIHGEKFAPYIQQLGIETNGDYVETTIELTAGTHTYNFKQSLQKDLPLLFCENEEQLTDPNTKEMIFQAKVCKPFYNNIPLHFQYKSNLSGLSQVNYLFGTYKRKNPGQLFVQIQELEHPQSSPNLLNGKTNNCIGKLLRESSIDSSTLKDNTFTSFSFEPIKNSKDKTYRISIVLKNGNPEQCPGVWCGKWINR